MDEMTELDKDLFIHELLKEGQTLSNPQILDLLLMKDQEDIWDILYRLGQMGNTGRLDRISFNRTDFPSMTFFIEPTT